MSEISQRIKSVIKGVIRVTTQRNQRKIKSGKTARKSVKNAQKWKTKEWEMTAFEENSFTLGVFSSLCSSLAESNSALD
eukprot:6463775-Amphidinium_carterae.1